MIRVLFLCTGNSCRSQMAEGLARHFGKGRVEPFSAGVLPSFVHPLAMEVMREIGIDISGQRSKSVTAFTGREFDYLVTLCDHARQTCPVFPGAARRLHWDIEDPVGATGTEGERLRAFRAARDEIRDRVLEFLKSLTE